MHGLNPLQSANNINLVRKKLLQFRRYGIFSRGLFFIGAPCSNRVQVAPSEGQTEGQLQTDNVFNRELSC